MQRQGLVQAFGQAAGPNPGIYSPEHISVSPDGATVYATDLASNRVLVLAVTSDLPAGR